MKTLCGRLVFGLGLFGLVFVLGGLFKPSPPGRPERPNRYSVTGDELKEGGLLERELYWADRVGYPTGKFDPAWVRGAVAQDAAIERAIPAGATPRYSLDSPLALDPSGFTALGPAPEHMTGCVGCFNYSTTQGRVNAIAVDPTTTVNGSIVAYAASVGGGVWKTTNCCSGSTTWSVLTDDPLVSTTSVDTLAIDPNNHNTIYAGTGDLNFGSFSMGSQGILKSTNGGASWTVLGASVFGSPYPEPAGQFPQYQSVGKVRVDPNDSNRVAAGTKTGLYLSYDGGANWTGPCLTNGFSSQRQDITGLELTNVGSGVTRILAAVGPRGFATPVQSDLGNNGANGIYKGTMPVSGCPTDFASIAGNANGFVFGTSVSGSPYSTGANMNAGSGTAFVSTSTGNQLGRVEIAVAPSDPNVLYAQVQSIAFNNNSGCGNTNGCQLGVWASTNGGTSWSFLAGSAGGSLRACGGASSAGDYSQNWYDQAIAVDPNNPDRVFISTFDVWFATRTGTSFNDTTCGYTYSGPAGPVHVDQHAIAFVSGSSSIMLIGNDGGVHGTTSADTATSSVSPSWFNMDSGFNTIEFYSGDISGSFASSGSPQASGGAQDNGSSSVTFGGSPTGPVQWQMGLGGDGFYSRIDPVGTGSSLRIFQGGNSGSLYRCTSNCTSAGASYSSVTGSWTADTRSFIVPYDLFHGGVAGGDDCAAAGVPGGCGHLIVGSTRVWETVAGGNNSMNNSSWYVTNNPSSQNMTKQTLDGRSFINQLKYSPKFQSVAMVGTNDGNAWIGFNLGTGSTSQATWVDVTGSNSVLPNRPILGVALDPSVGAANIPVGYAAMGGFDQNTPATPGHVFQVTCDASCASPTWANKSGNLPNIPVDSIIVNPNVPQQVFAGTDIGLYYTNDVTVASPVWYRFSNGLPSSMIWDMQIDRGSTTLSVWTRGRGAFVWPLPTSLSVSPSASAQALRVDPVPDGTSSDGNGIFEPGETVFIRPSWKNVSVGTIGLTGTASNFTGPAGPVYTLTDSSAAYGLVAPGATNNCGSATGDCYAVGVSSVTGASKSLAPSVARPSTHWDATVTETPSTGEAPKAWTLHIGDSFTDVPRNHVFYQFVERILHSGVTTGCTGTTYCPDDNVFRLQMAAFIARAQAGGDANVPVSGSAQGNPYSCVNGGTSLFTDVSPTDPFCRHVHYIFATGVTTGCVTTPPRQYCPGDDVNRGQMALFIARGVAGSDAAVPVSYGPDPVTGRSYSCNPASPNLHFIDITTSDIFCRHAHYLWAKDVISGFPDNSYQPGGLVTRGAMSKFLANGFNLVLYKP